MYVKTQNYILISKSKSKWSLYSSHLLITLTNNIIHLTLPFFSLSLKLMSHLNTFCYLKQSKKIRGTSNIIKTNLILSKRLILESWDGKYSYRSFLFVYRTKNRHLFLFIQF